VVLDQIRQADEIRLARRYSAATIFAALAACSSW
jgi:hypothetical protein